MQKINLGLIGFGTVGSGVVKFLKEKQTLIRERFDTEFTIRAICDRSIHKKSPEVTRRTTLTTDISKVLNDDQIDVIVELIGGMHPAAEIAFTALRKKKHFVTANKELIARQGKELFKEAAKYSRNIYFEASVGAGIPILKTVTEGLAGNTFKGLYGIINGTSNFILTEMSLNGCSFSEALKRAQKKGYAESNPTLDLNGMDAAHKLAILTFLTQRKFVQLEDIFVEGITEISHEDISYAKSMGLTIKLLAIAQRVENQLEMRVHPTLISEDHPLASVNGIHNAIFLDTDPAGDILLYGEGAGQMSAASGVVSDLINLAIRQRGQTVQEPTNLYKEVSAVKIRKLADSETEFYIRFMAIDRPGVLSQISGILGRHGISIASLSQRVRKKSSAVPIVMLTHSAKERMLKKALEKIYNLNTVRSKPVAIRMENF